MGGLKRIMTLDCIIFNSLYQWWGRKKCDFVFILTLSVTQTIYSRMVGCLIIWKGFGKMQHFPTEVLYHISLKGLRNQEKLQDV
jgi:hypothetical protein